MSFVTDIIEGLLPTHAYAEEPDDEDVAEDVEDEEEDDDDDDDDDEDIVDPMETLRDECQKSASCTPHVTEYASCVERVTKAEEEPGYDDKEYKESCVEEFFALQKCVNDCSAPKLFSKLK